MSKALRPEGQRLHQKNMAMRNWILGIVLIVGGIFAAPILGTYVLRVVAPAQKIHTHNENAPNRDLLHQLHRDIPLGASRVNVLNKYWEVRSADLKLDVESPSMWYVYTPVELGSLNWILEITFSAEEQVVALRIRTSDGPQPPDGPQDKGL